MTCPNPWMKFSPGAATAPPDWPEMAVWDPADAVRDAGLAFEGLERLGMGLIRRISGVALGLVALGGLVALAGRLGALA